MKERARRSEPGRDLSSDKREQTQSHAEKRPCPRSPRVRPPERSTHFRIPGN
jgi:hypothetical protein